MGFRKMSTDKIVKRNKLKLLQDRFLTLFELTGWVALLAFSLFIAQSCNLL